MPAAMVIMLIAGCGGETPQVPKERLPFERPLAVITWPKVIRPGDAVECPSLPDAIRAPTDLVVECSIATSEMPKPPFLLVEVQPRGVSGRGSPKKVANCDRMATSDGITSYRSQSMTLRESWGKVDVRVIELSPGSRKVISVRQLDVLSNSGQHDDTAKRS